MPKPPDEDGPFGRGPHEISDRTIVHVGRPVEILGTERQWLEEYARAMEAASRGGKVGWLVIYMRMHKSAMGVLQTIMRRSHAD